MAGGKGKKWQGKDQDEPLIVRWVLRIYDIIVGHADTINKVIRFFYTFRWVFIFLFALNWYNLYF